MTHQVSNFYNETFYKMHSEISFRSAKRFVDYLTRLYQPSSVIDVGCGRGYWLKAFKENGADKVVGLDGDWNSQEMMVDQSISFKEIDLNRLSLKINFIFDLAISLEVAEHLHKSSARAFVKYLTQLSDVVMFSAAYLGQGGVNHINERPHTYWAKLFKSYGYVPIDLFRPVFWGVADIDVCYQQNTFLYVKSSSALIEKLREAGHQPIENIAFMDCIHPILYATKLPQNQALLGSKKILRRIIPAPARLVISKLRSLFK